MARGKKGTVDPELTPKQMDDLEKVLRLGMTVTDACTFVGISRETFYKWARVGNARPPGDPLRKFADAVANGRASAKVNAVAHVHAGMKKDWKAAAWFLGVAFPKEFGPKVKVTIEQELGAALERLAKVLPEDMYDRALDALAGEGGEDEEDGAGPAASGDDEGRGP